MEVFISYFKIVLTLLIYCFGFALIIGVNVFIDKIAKKYFGTKKKWILRVFKFILSFIFATIILIFSVFSGLLFVYGIFTFYLFVAFGMSIFRIFSDLELE
jgi:hypothetical protein